MENWTDEILGSLDSIERAKPDEHVFLKIQERIELSDSKIKKMSPPQWLAVAAGILMIIGLNAYFVADYYQTDSLAVELDTSYQLLSNYNIY